MRSTRTTALVGVQPSESVTRPGHGRYQSGEQGRPLTPPPSAHHHQPISISPSALPSLSAKAWWAFADGLLVFEPLSAFHTSAAQEKFKGTQARTKNTPGWSVSAVSEECWLTFSKFNSHTLSDSTKTTHCTYNTGLPRVWWHMLEKPHQVLSTVKNSVKKNTSSSAEDVHPMYKSPQPWVFNQQINYKAGTSCCGQLPPGKEVSTELPRNPRK